MNAGADDARWRSSGGGANFSNSVPNERLGNEAGDSWSRWDRFSTPGLAQGQYISSAMLSISFVNQAGAGTIRLRHKFEAADASTAVVSVADIQGRTLTTASTLFSDVIGNFSSPMQIDVTAQLREVVNRAGYVGGAIGSSLVDEGSDTGAVLQAKFFDESSSVAASIFVCVQEESSASSTSSLSSSSSTSSLSSTSSTSSILAALGIVSAGAARVGLRSAASARTGLVTGSSSRAGLESADNART